MPASDPAPSGLPVIDESIDSVGTSTWHFLKRHPGYVTYPIIAVIALEVFMGLKGVPASNLYFFPLLLPFFGYSFARAKVQHEFMQQFAAANGYTYTAKVPFAGLDGLLFQIGYAKTVVDLVSGTFQNNPISLFTYSYTTGAGKSQQTHNSTVYELQFDIKLPDMLIESAGHTFGSSLFMGYSGGKKEMIKLEGDFNKYFSLSVPRGYEIEALEIFTPDVMAELIDHAKKLSLEIVNGHLFIYDNGVVSTKQALYDLYGVAQYFVEKLAPLLARMKPSMDAMQAERAEAITH